MPTTMAPVKMPVRVQQLANEQSSGGQVKRTLQTKVLRGATLMGVRVGTSPKWRAAAVSRSADRANDKQYAIFIDEIREKIPFMVKAL